MLPRSGSSNYWEVLYRLEYTSSEFAFGFKLDTDGTFATSGVMANGANGANRNKPRTTHYGKNLKWFIENDRAIYMHGNNDGGGGGSNPMSVVTSASRVDGQSVGEMAFETDTKRLIIWDGTMWLSTKNSRYSSSTHRNISNNSVYWTSRPFFIYAINNLSSSPASSVRS